MQASQVSAIPRTVVRLRGRAIATYDATAFLDTRAIDLGGRVTARYTRRPVLEAERRHVEIAVAIVTVLATLSLIVLLSLNVLSS
jgi:hypothetical protein